MPKTDETNITGKLKFKKKS